jgi:hypothetical protein
MATATVTENKAKQFLIASIAVTVLLYIVPFGRLIGYPLVLISTLAHEMGHGISAVLVGAKFEEFHMYADASGVAFWAGYVGKLARSFISAGGLVGPAITAAVMFAFARKEKLARVFLLFLGAALLACEILVVRGAFGMVFVAVCIALAIAIGWKGASWMPQLTLVFIGVQLSLSVFSRGDYLFMKEARTGNGTSPSDVQHIADSLGGPFWFWGALCGAFSVLVLVAGVWMFFRTTKRGALGHKTVKTAQSLY